MRDILAEYRATLIQTARAENVIMTWPGRMVGGTLTLNDGELKWKRSAWTVPIAIPLLGPVLGILMDKGPKRVRLSVSETAVASAGRMVPWPHVICMALTWTGVGLFVSVPVVFLSGWARRCVAVHTPGDGKTYYFAVRDVEGWLADLEGAGARKAILN